MHIKQGGFGCLMYFMYFVYKNITHFQTEKTLTPEIDTKQEKKLNKPKWKYFLTNVEFKYITIIMADTNTPHQCYYCSPPALLATFGSL